MKEDRLEINFLGILAFENGIQSIWFHDIGS
jgi:hypothetical protein